MEAVLDFFRSVNALVPEYPRWLFWTVMAGVVLLTQAIKLPVKALTKKIPNDALRQKVNLVILVIPVGLGLLASWLLTYAGYEFLYNAGIVWGVTSTVIYELATKAFKRIKSGEDITGETLKADLNDAQKNGQNVQSVADEFQSIINPAKTKISKKK